MKSNNKSTTIMAILSLALLVPGNPAVQADILDLDFTGLEDLGSAALYEGWLIVDGAPVSTGTFSVDGSGAPSPSSFEVGDALDRASSFVLTIEANPDPDTNPSDTHLLAGDFNQGSATLSVGHPAALGDDFLGASGSFILAVPSDTSGSASHTQGIWWLDPDAGPGPALNLPTLPAGWVYEGWVIGPGGPVSTGTFTAVDGPDGDGGGPASGPGDTPPFPGQDFIDPATDLIGHAAVISIEPFPDNSPGPFILKPLVDANIEDVGGGVLQEMANVAAGFPTGIAIPEPSSMLLLIWASLAMFGRRQLRFA